jgi:hypothetical protein
MNVLTCAALTVCVAESFKVAWGDVQHVSESVALFQVAQSGTLGEMVLTRLWCVRDLVDAQEAGALQSPEEAP